MSQPLSTPTLPAFSWVANLKKDDRELLSSYGHFMPGLPGSVIIQQGKPQDSLYVVVSGLLDVKVTQEGSHEEVHLAQIGPGETLGEISLFDPGPATATVTAIDFVQLWCIADADLNQFIEDNPGAGNILLRSMMAIIARRLRRLDPLAFGLS